MPAIIMHAGAGVLLIIMTNFASHNKTTKTQIHKSQITKSNKPPLPHIHIANINCTTHGARDGVAVAAAVVMLTCARNIQ